VSVVAFTIVVLIDTSIGKMSLSDPSEHAKFSCGLLVEAVDCRSTIEPAVDKPDTVPETVQMPPVDRLVTVPVSVAPV